MSDITRKITGFTLLEVLIAVLVFSIGMLGLASLQATGLKLGSDSLLRSIATVAASDIADRMRANLPALSLGTTSPYNNPTANRTGDPACLGKNASGTEINIQCDANAMALHDFYEWYSSLRGQAATSWYPQVRQMLPAGDGIVCVDSTPDDGTPTSPQCDGLIITANRPVFAIKVWWRERKDETSPGTLQRFVTSLSI